MSNHLEHFGNTGSSRVRSFVVEADKLGRSQAFRG